MAENTHASPPSAELYKALSIECFYDYLRFEAFQNFKEIQRKELIKIALRVPLKEGDTLKDMFQLIKEDNLEGAVLLLKSRQIKDLPPTGKNVEGMIDAYFAEIDPSRALKFLRFLMYFPPDQAAAYENFLKSYLSAKPFKRDTMLPSVMYNAFTL
jgi:hypothetical protein